MSMLECLAFGLYCSSSGELENDDDGVVQEDGAENCVDVEDVGDKVDEVDSWVGGEISVKGVNGVVVVKDSYRESKLESIDFVSVGTVLAV